MEKSEGEGILLRTRSKWEIIIKSDLKERLEGEDRTYPAYDKGQGRKLAGNETSETIKRGKFLIRWLLFVSEDGLSARMRLQLFSI